jgi:hypothetical protein
MVLCRGRTYRLFSCGLVPLCLLVLAVFWGYGLVRAGASKPAGAEERLRGLLTQRYEILQQMVKNEQLQMESGRVDVLTFQKLTDALYRAQADLCTTAAERVKVYEKLVEVLAAQEKLIERQAEAGRARQAQVDEGKLVTLNARIDLERLRLGQSTPQP